MIACHIGLVVLAVEAAFCRCNFKYQRLAATLWQNLPVSVRPPDFCRCNISGKVPLCQLNAPAGSLCLCHEAKCHLFPDLSVYSDGRQQIVLVPVPYFPAAGM